MALNFPSTTGQPTDGSYTYESGGKIYAWDGTSWNVSAVTNIISGSTASRPSVSVPIIYFNTDTNEYEAYNPSTLSWSTLTTVSTPVFPSTNGETSYTVPGSYSFIPPEGVNFVSVVCVGSGGYDGGGGGGLAWSNHIPVVPGQSYTVFVGSATTSGASGGAYFISSDFLFAGGGNSSGGVGSYIAQASAYGTSGGSSGGIGNGANAGGGAAGYTGNGGNSYLRGQTSGAGGGGGGGGQTDAGGGVGLYGEGANGAYSTNGGGGGSGGQDGGNAGGQGGNFGGGGGNGALGGSAAVRIIWGPNREFPNTNTGAL